MPERRLVLLVGLPASGKSTFVAGRKGVLSSDAVRELLRDDETDQSIHSHVFRVLRELLRTRLLLEAPVTYIDATNLSRKFRRPFLRIGQSFGAVSEAVCFDTPLEECLRRNAARARVVPPQALREMAARFEPPSFAEGFDVITRIGITGESASERRPGS